jgi:CRP/FNR family cyclic AMP-dependent transcriptional regulator
MHVPYVRIGKGNREIYHFLSVEPSSIMGFMFQRNLKNLPILKGLDHKSVNLILPLLDPCTFPDQHKVFQQDTVASHFFILLEGEVVVKYKPYDGEELAIARICPEDVFGWSAALGRPKYTSSAYTSTPCVAVRIQVQQLQKFCESNPQLGMILLERLASGIAYRLRSTYDEVLALLTRGLDFVPEK